MAAELCRLNLLATPFAGNVPHYDIIASGQAGGAVAIQVKAINGKTWQFDIRKFVKATLAEDEKHQVIGERESEPYPGLICVLVVLSGTGKDRFFVLKWKELQAILVRGYKAYLLKHGHVRPKAPASFHTALAIKDVEPFESKWHKILDKVPQPPME